MKKTYQHLFFDLDRTLWDFEKNSKETIYELFHEFNLHLKNITSFDAFYTIYRLKNHELWALYRQNKITKDELRQERFHRTMQEFFIDDKELALEFNDRYVETCSKKPHLLPNAISVLDYLKDNYRLHIITNGFIEAQFVKLKNSGIEKYFDEVIISELLGTSKPDPVIFEHALQKSGAQINESIMIGDDFESDIIGAHTMGMDSIYLADFPKKSTIKPTFHIKELIELKKIL